MNILHITTFLQGGAGKIIKDIAINQKNRDNNVYIITSKTEEIGYCNYDEYLNLLSEKEIPVFKIDSSFKRDIYLNLQVAEKVQEIIKKYNIDFIHTHAAVPAMIGIIARSGLDKYIPVIQTMHGWGTNKELKHEKMDITIMNSLDKIVTVSNNDMSLMISKGIDKDKLVTIYNGLEKSSYTINNEDKIIEKIKYMKDNKYTILGCIGTVCDRKNHKLLVNALKKIDRSKKIFTVFIGEGDKLAKLEEQVASLGLSERIKFCGYKENASKYIKHFDYLIFTSLSEGFSIAILEGFREKTPIIASDIAPFKEVIVDSITGFLFKNNNEDSLVDVIEKAYFYDEDSLSKIRKNAYNKYINNFTFEKMMLQYNNIYRSESAKRNFPLQEKN